MKREGEEDNSEEERANMRGEEEAKRGEAEAGVWMSGGKRRGRLMRMGSMSLGEVAGAGRLTIGTITETSTGCTTEGTVWIIMTVTIAMEAVHDEARQLGEEMLQPTTKLRLDMTKTAERTHIWERRKVVRSDGIHHGVRGADFLLLGVQMAFTCCIGQMERRHEHIIIYLYEYKRGHISRGYQALSHQLYHSSRGLSKARISLGVGTSTYQTYVGDRHVKEGNSGLKQSLFKNQVHKFALAY